MLWGGGHVGINEVNMFIFKYTGLHMETGFGGLSTFVLELVDPRNATFWLKLKCALLPLILVHMESLGI